MQTLYLINDKVDGHFEKKKEILDSTNKNKEVLIKYTKLWDRIKNSIQKVNNKFGEYGKDFMEIKFSSDNNLPFKWNTKLHNITIIIKSIFEGDVKYYPQVFLDECLYEL